MQAFRVQSSSRATGVRAASQRPALPSRALSVRQLRSRSQRLIARATPEDAEAAAATAAPSTSSDAAETVFYEGSGSNAELALSVLLGFTLIYAPLTIASLGRRAWFKYRFTNKRVTVTNSSPLFKNEVEVAYSQIKEIRSVPRAFGAWGDMVIFLKNGDRLEIAGLENFRDIQSHIERNMRYE